MTALTLRAALAGLLLTSVTATAAFAYDPSMSPSGSYLAGRSAAKLRDNDLASDYLTNALKSDEGNPILTEKVFLLELAGRGHHLVHDPCTARVLDRWPPAQTGGVNAFSRQMYVPYRWHHFVGRRTPAGLEVYMDGERVGVSPVDPGDASAACRLMVGRLKQGTQANVDQERPFVGRLAELAVYDHPLDPAEIRRHHDLGARRR